MTSISANDTFDYMKCIKDPILGPQSWSIVQRTLRSLTVNDDKSISEASNTDASTSITDNPPDSDEFKYTNNLHFFACIMIWDIIFCIIVHLVAAISCFYFLYKHKYGRRYSLLILFSGIFHPLGVGIVSSLILAVVLSEMNTMNLANPGMSLFIGLCLNFIMVMSNTVLRRYLRFI